MSYLSVFSPIKVLETPKLKQWIDKKDSQNISLHKNTKKCCENCEKLRRE